MGVGVGWGGMLTFMLRWWCYADHCTFWLSCSDGTQRPHLLKAVGSLATKAYRLEDKKCLFLGKLCVRVAEPLGLAKMMRNPMVKMGRSEHRFHHDLSNTLQNAALNPWDSFRSQQWTRPQPRFEIPLWQLPGRKEIWQSFTMQQLKSGGPS